MISAAAVVTSSSPRLDEMGSRNEPSPATTAPSWLDEEMGIVETAAATTRALQTTALAPAVVVVASAAVSRNRRDAAGA